ncbi:MAG: radical SAM protein [Sphaerochaetaceae bacterium]|nr:radical SAM protein [Sphaerochaetaceae bacterium]
MATDKLLFGTKEWAPNNFNFMNGCSNDCVYCYAKSMAIRFKRKTADTWKKEEPVNMKGKSYKHKEGRIMVPSSHDITPTNIEIALPVIDKLIASDNELLIVTKPNFECTQKIVDSFKEKKEQIAFRFTIGSTDSSVLKLWEPFASNFEERLKSLKYAFDSGYSTSISCEPLLDDHFNVLYDSVFEYVTDSIWVGKMNMARNRVNINTKGTFPIEKIDALIKSQSDEKIVALFEAFKDKDKIQWKESIKKVAISHGLL